MPWDGIERRKENRMVKDNFQPQTAFEGYMKASMENLEKRFDNLHCDRHSKRIGDCENSIANIKGKAGVIGIVASVVTSFVMKHIMGK